MRELLEAGAMVDLQNFEGVSALMLAAKYGDPGVVRALLAAGAQVGHYPRRRLSGSGTSRVCFVKHRFSV